MAPRLGVASVTRSLFSLGPMGEIDSAALLQATHLKLPVDEG